MEPENSISINLLKTWGPYFMKNEKVTFYNLMKVLSLKIKLPYFTIIMRHLGYKDV